MSEETNEGGEETVILARMTDAVQAGALRELLENEGIPVSTPGLEHRSLLGMAGGYVEILVRVPSKDLARAKELEESLRSATPVEAPEASEKPRTDRIRRVAVFAAFFVPGGGHFYARRWNVGFFLLALQLVTIGCAFVWPLFWYAVPAIALADAIGAASLVGADQRGEPPTRIGRVAPLFGLIALLLVPASRGLTPHLLAGPAMVQACARAAECDGGEDVERCIAAAAERTFEGRGTREHDLACAECLAQSLCEDIPFECGECDGLVHLPAATSLGTHAPVDGADELLHVVPTLFPAEQHGPPSPEVEDMLRLLEDSTAVPGPAGPP